MLLDTTTIEMASKTLCAAFWQHSVVRSDNNIFACCRYKSPVQKFTGDITSVLNSSEYDKLRQDSINGIFNPNCQKCYYEESLGKFSTRNYLNSVYDTNDINLKYLEIGFDNICNLTCDGCRGEFSSSWANIENPTIGKKFNIRSTVEITSVPLTIERINFLGGEPLMTNRHKDFLKLVSTPHTVNITYNTNGTFLLDDETYYLLKHFKSVKFIISIDGFQELNEKVRSGSKWEDVIKFIDQIKTLGFDIQIHSVLHINNWFGIVDLSKFINDNNLLWSLTVLTYPKHLDIINLTREQKIEFINLLDKVDMNPNVIKIFPQTANKEYIIKHLGILK